MTIFQLNCQFFKNFGKIKFCCKKVTACNVSTKNQHFFNYSSFQFKTPNIPSERIKIDKNQILNVFAKVNDQIINNTQGRLFAVVYIQGRQYKVTTEDILVIRNHWSPNTGDQIRLEKVLLIGSSNFTLMGTPLLPLDQVSVHATVLEKTFSHTYPLFYFKRRKNFQKLNFFKDELTYLRINTIKLTGEVNKLGDTDGFKNRIF